MNLTPNISFTLEPAGGPFHDPAILLSPTNSSLSLLLDCGTLTGLKTRNLQKVRWVFLSHLHIDHLIGFDHLLRVRLFSDIPLTVFGPPGTVDTIAHRLQGYAWNLTSGSPFVVYAVDLPLDEAEAGASARFACHEKFERTSFEPVELFGGCVGLESDLTVRWTQVEHGVPCYAYRIDRSFLPQFSPQACVRLGLRPGRWVSELTAGRPLTLEVEGVERDQAWLSERLLTVRPPERIGYLTDTRLALPLRSKLAEFFRGANLLLSESAYLAAEEDAATANLHMTTHQVAQLADEAGVDFLLLFHLSRRHMEKGPHQHLQEVRALFPRADLLLRI